MVTRHPDLGAAFGVPVRREKQVPALARRARITRPLNALSQPTPTSVFSAVVPQNWGRSRAVLDGKQPPLGPQVFGSASSFRFVVMAAGLLLVVFSVVFAFLMAKEGSPVSIAVLFGVVFGAVGAMVVSGAVRYKRHWIVADDQGLS